MQEKTDLLATLVRYFKGVGPKKCESLAKIGIVVARDLLYHLPGRYEDRSRLVSISALRPGEHETVRGKVFSISNRVTRRGVAALEAVIRDGSGDLAAVWYRQPFLKSVIKEGRDIILFGKVERYGRLQMSQPEFEFLDEGDEESLHINRVVPIYPLTGDLTQRYMRGLVFSALTRCASSAPEIIPTNLRARLRLVDIKFALWAIHFPSSFDALERAYQRIVFDEFFVLQLAHALKRRALSGQRSGVLYVVAGGLVEAFASRLPFLLTEGQKAAITDVEKDMSSGRPMHRLLEGDVGSGKTIIAAHAAVLAVQNGLQAAVMAPTEVLARQHYLTLSNLLAPLGIRVVLLARGISDKEKAQILDEISSGSAQVVIATHAIIQKGISFKALGLAVVDEQHKFGVEQRSLLKGKGVFPHLLVMTATPIPRTLSLTIFGDLDISVIRELPKGRKPIVTYWVDEEKRQHVYDFVRSELAKGRQAFVIYPRVGKASDPARSALSMHQALSSGPFSGYRVAVLHGKMDPREKDSIMADFKERKIDLLVSTVVIEVGIDVPNATVMVIENADRFGLAQLHQLRGRVGRGEHESFCILLADPRTDEARKRLQIIEETVDGFEIAEEDLNIRGPGEFFGTSQHGLPEIRYGDLVKDFSIMELARKEAFAIVERDPGLREDSHILLKKAIVERFGGKADVAGVG